MPLRFHGLSLLICLLFSTAPLFGMEEQAFQDSCRLHLEKLKTSEWQIQKRKGQIAKLEAKIPPRQTESRFQYLARNKIPLDFATFSALELPFELHPFIDPKTGVLNYTNPNPYRLPIENGDQKIATMRIHLLGPHSSADPKLDQGMFDDVNQLLLAIPDLEIIVVMAKTPKHPSEDPALAAWIRKSFQNMKESERVRFSFHPSDQLISRWSRDDSLPTEDKTLVQPRRYLQPEFAYNEARKNALIALNKDNEFKYLRSPFTFEWGDLISGARHLFIGQQTLLANRLLLKVSGEEVLNAFASEFGKKVKLIDTANFGRDFFELHQHIDLLMMDVRDRVQKDEVIFLSSPMKAKELIEEWIKNHPKEVEENTVNGFHASWLLKRLSTNTELLRQWQRWIEHTRKDLTSEGYRVVEVPGYALKNPDPMAAMTGQHFIYYNYTNSNLSPGVIQMPWMNVPAFDDFMKSSLEGMGYQVVWAKSAFDFFKRQGGTRCGSNCWYK